jgi:DivIVA domain-containing protein
VWLIASIAAVVGGLAVLIATWLESEAHAEPVPTGPVTPEELRHHGLPLAWRGYAPGHVDALLARAAATLEQARFDVPSQVHEGTMPGFIAATFGDDAVPGAQEVTGSQAVPGADDADDEPDGDPYAWAWDDPSSGEELEDGGGDGPGSLDR